MQKMSETGGPIPIVSMRFRHIRRRCLSAIVVSVFLAATPFHAAGTDDHPAVETARTYLQAVVAGDWTTCADLILPKALERKKRETVEVIKNSPTVSEETERLKMLGIASFKDLEAMSPAAFYIAERNAVHKAIDESAASKARQLSTLKIEVLSVGVEEDGSFVHVLVRTHRDTEEIRVHELMLVSLLKDSDVPGKWRIVPDTQLPVSEPLPETGDAPDASKEKKKP